MRLDVSRGSGAWLGIISLPALWFVWVYEGLVDVDRLYDGSLFILLIVSVIGAAGMAVGGLAGAYFTRMVRPAVLRVVVLTVIVPGIAFVAASLPFLIFAIYGAIVAWSVSVTQ